MKKTIAVLFTAILLLLSSAAVQSQVYTGGSFGIHYDRTAYADVAPILGYRAGILDFGISPFFSYLEVKDLPDRYSYGNRIFMQITLIRNVYAHAEFEVSNIATSVIGADGKRERKWITGLPLGGGYRYNLTDRTRAYGMILYDVLLDEDSPVQNPIIRAGVTHSF